MAQRKVLGWGTANLHGQIVMFFYSLLHSDSEASIKLELSGKLITYRDSLLIAAAVHNLPVCIERLALSVIGDSG